MKLIIAGGRDYTLTPEDHKALSKIHEETPVNEVVSGGARGADTCGEIWAKNNDVAVARFPADWEAHGKAAGHIRNREMANYADAVALFPGGRGTENMFKTAQKLGLKIFDFR